MQIALFDPRRNAINKNNSENHEMHYKKTYFPLTYFT